MAPDDDQGADGESGPGDPLPSDEALVSYIAGFDQPVSRRDIARAFKIKGDQRVVLKERLRALESAGRIARTAGKDYTVPQGLPAVTVLEVTGVDLDGEPRARPTRWDSDFEPPAIVVASKKNQPEPAVGERILARLSRQDDGSYLAYIMRRLPAGPSRVLGTLERVKGGYVLTPTAKKDRKEYVVPDARVGEAGDGELVLAQPLPGPKAQRRSEAKVVERLGDVTEPKAISLIAIHTHEIPTAFSDEAISEAEQGSLPPAKGRSDRRDLPLVTIDGADAKDFDDAVFAEPDPERPGGWHIVVAIADVAYYVRPGSVLDKEAYERGNSVYFPDRVVPMLPEQLSNDLCSLNPGVDRACLAMHCWLDSDGVLQNYRVERALMRSRARLTYEQVQAARDGAPDEATAPLVENVIAPLYDAFAVLQKNRRDRGTLDLDMPENEVNLDEHGRVTEISTRQRLDSHRLIEEFMICANVAAARALEARDAPAMYRIHDDPDPDKLDSLDQFLKSLGLKFNRGQHIQPRAFTKLLDQAEKMGLAGLLTKIVLRSQAQAKYSPENIGHFGLALPKYAHFTSPIRRYADLLVHRSLITAYGLGPGGLRPDDGDNFDDWGEHISQTERRAQEAERDAHDRYLAHYLASQEGATFTGHIGGVTRFGLFVTLDETGADGLVPIKTLPDDYYVHDEQRHALIGRHTGRIFRLGAPVRVRLVEANALSGSTLFTVLNTEGADLPALAGGAAQLPDGGDADTLEATEPAGRGPAPRGTKGAKAKHKGADAAAPAKKAAAKKKAQAKGRGKAAKNKARTKAKKGKG